MLNFAPDTGTERILTALLFLPLFCADVFVFITFKKGRLLSLKNMRLALTILSAAVYAFSFPSFLNLQGFGFLIFAAFIPLLIVFKISSVKRGIFYGIAFGIIQTMIINYWLATFSLVSLQFVTALYTALFTFFMMFAVYVYKKSKYGWLLFPFAWIVFEWARSIRIFRISLVPYRICALQISSNNSDCFCYRYLGNFIFLQFSSIHQQLNIYPEKIPIAESEGIPFRQKTTLKIQIL